MRDTTKSALTLGMLVAGAMGLGMPQAQAQEVQAQAAPGQEVPGQQAPVADGLRYSLTYSGRFVPATNDAVAMGLGTGPALRLGVEGLFMEELGLGVVVYGDTRSATPFNNSMKLDWERTAVMAEVDYGMRFFNDRLRPAARLGLGYMHHELDLYADGGTSANWSNRFEGSAGSFAFTAQAVVDVTLLQNSSRTLSLALTGAWGLAGHTSANFDAMEPVYADSDRVERAPIDAGAAGAFRLGGEIGFSLVWQP
ncbi:hypothetical protein FRC98_14625 [Lujinxingia vulgaris]|uniref:Outer membrane protein beta-barrel domain-containing protein n=1 Tax=Lujinxingia vulgaris TaxID=2600176 RepID=A0A5C6X252_9DELT|nr:hypothetical protein [Lujinxingia vulgaris]TXD35902.1 hypothetical protein FRC98_14625 [Lujinxingia vulgaris]